MSYAKTRRRLAKIQHAKRIRNRARAIIVGSMASWINTKTYVEFPPSRRHFLFAQQVLNALARSDRILSRQRLAAIERYPGCPIFQRDVRGDIHRCQLRRDHAGVCMNIDGYALVGSEITPEHRVDIALWLDEEPR